MVFENHFRRYRTQFRTTTAVQQAYWVVVSVKAAALKQASLVRAKPIPGQAEATNHSATYSSAIQPLAAKSKEVGRRIPLIVV